MTPDQFTVASFMSVELQARDISDDRLQQRLALNKRQACRVAAVEVQKIKGVKDQARPPISVRRGLGFGKARKAVGPYSTQFAVEMGCLRPEGGKRGLHDGIFVGSVEACPGQKLCSAALEPHCHPETVQLNLVQPLLP